MGVTEGPGASGLRGGQNEKRGAGGLKLKQTKKTVVFSSSFSCSSSSFFVPAAK